MRKESLKGWGCRISDRIRMRGMLCMVGLLFSFLGSTSLIADTDILVIGCSRSYSRDYFPTIPRVQDPFNAELVANQLRSILAGDPAAGVVNVTFEDTYAVRTTEVSSKRYSLLNYYYWPDGKAERINNLKGAAGTEWDYVVLVADPSFMASTPGVYAKGVKLLVDTIRQGTATPILMMPWAHAGSSVPATDFGEVCYRVGDSGGIAVAPAGFAWDSLTTKDTSTTHPTTNGAYLAAATIYSQIFNKNAKDSTYTYNDPLADHALLSVQTHRTQSHYTGHYNVANPHLGFAFKDREIRGNMYSSSTESTIVDDDAYNGGRNMASIGRSHLSTIVAGSDPAGKKFYLTARWSYFYDHEVNLGIPYQVRDWDSSIDNGGLDMLFGIDTMSEGRRGGTRLAFFMISDGDVPRNVRCVPNWLLWAEVNDVLGVARPFFEPTPDGRHFNGDVNEAIGACAVTMLTGRCPIDKGGPDNERECRRIGYETAWTMSTLNLRAPGFTVHPGSLGPKTLLMGEEDELTTYFVNAPRSNVTVNVSVNPSTAAIVSPSVLTFDSTNHDVIRNIRLTGIPGGKASENFDVVFTTSSEDMCFNGLSDSWKYTLQRNPGDPAETTSYDVIENPTRKLSVFSNAGLDVDLQVSAADTLNTTFLQPFNGTVSWVGSMVRYQPDSGYVGEDGFSYYTIYGGKLYKGYFQIEVLAPGSATRVSVTATDSSASEAGDTGAWTITREGDISAALQVAYALSGSAHPSDYTVSAASPVTIPAGLASVVITLTPVNDGLKEATELATLALQGGEGFQVGVDLAGIAIADDDNAVPVAHAGGDQSVAITDQALWTPAYRPDGRTVGWYDASDLQSFASNNDGEVTQCNDKSGYQNHIVRNTIGPASGTRTLSGMNVFDFPAISRLRRVGVYRPRNDGNLAVCLVADVDSASGNLVTFVGNPSLTWTAGGAVSPGGFNLGHGLGPVMGSVVCDLGAGKVLGYVDGADAGTATNYTQALNPIQDLTLASPDAAIAELIVTEDISAGTRHKIEGYLAWKWGREAQLPETHPYKGFAPMVPVAIASLSGSATDADDASLTSSWSMVSGPMAVEFADATAPNSTVTFYAVGTYLLRLSVTDGAATVHDDVVITVTENNLPIVSVTALDGSASEAGPDAGSFVFSRIGDTAAPQNVSFTLGGTATAGSDYAVASTTSVTIPAGASSAVLVITPVDDSVYGERAETVQIAITPDAGYLVNSLWPDAELTIEDNDNRAPVVDAGADQSVNLVEGDITPSAVAGADIFLNAGLDNGANGTWEDSLSKWSPTLSSGVTFLANAGSSLPGITSAYAFPGGTADGPGFKGVGLQDLGEDQQSISLELWFKPTASASYPPIGQVLWETGQWEGCGIFYRDGVVKVGVNNDPSLLSADVSLLTDEFIQMVVTFNRQSSTNNWKLYINGRLKATASRSDTDISSSNDAGLGTRNGSPAGGSQSLSFTESFKGQIAIFRSYFRQVLSDAEVLTNYLSIAGDYETADVALGGVVTDPDGDPVSATWTKVSGPERVFFDDPSLPTATASFIAHGAYVLRLTATDDIETVYDEVTISVLAEGNTKPIINAQSVTTQEDTPVAITLTGYDLDGDPISYQVVSGPAHGYLSGSAPDLTYNPNADFFGTDSFTFKANDGQADSDPAAVSITINAVSDAPVAYAGADQTVALSDGGPTVAVTVPNDGIVGFQGTAVGGNSTVGSWPAGEDPSKAIDGSTGTKYLNLGKAGSGFYVTPGVGLWTLSGIKVYTANDAPERDPFTISIEGASGGDLSQGSSWTLIQNNVALGLTADPGRQKAGPLVTIANSAAYQSYRIIVQSLRDAASANSVQYSEVELYSFATTSALDGAVTDADGDAITVVWSVVSKPTGSIVTFDNSSLVKPTVSMDSPGTYVLRLTATDGIDTVYDEVTITVVEEGAMIVSVATGDASAAEAGTDTGSWTISRSGDTTDPLLVNFSLGGTATAGADYTLDATSPVTIPAGQSSVTITLTPVDDSDSEGPETVVLTLAPDAAYAVGTATGTITINDDEIPPSLVGHWMFDESAGTVADDASAADGSPNEYDGTIVGSPTWRPTGGRVGGALYFNGTDAHVDISGAAAALNGKSGVTVAMWVKADAVNVDRGMLHHTVAGSSDDGLACRFDAAGGSGGGSQVLKLTVTTSAGVAQIESSSNVQTTNWLHVAYTWESGQPVKLYLNGTADAAPTYTTGAKSGTLSIPTTLMIGSGPKARWQGLIDDVRIYSRALSGSEIQGLVAGNTAPVIAAIWADPDTVTLPGTAAVHVTASDADGDGLVYTWSKVSGPGTVSFTPNGTAASAASTASFSAAGTYVLGLTVSDGTTNAYDEVTITVASQGAVTVNHEVPHTWLNSINPAWTNDYEAAVLADPDGDGFTTWQEYWSGTDPQSSNSYLKIESVQFSGTNVVLEWQHALVGVIPAIVIQSTTNLDSGSWSNVGQKAISNGVNTWSYGSSLQGYYRLAVTNVP